MFRISALLGLALLAVGLVVGTTSSGEKKDKGTLPPGWKELNLNGEQKTKIYKIRAEFKSKIMDLEAKLKELRTKERTEMVKVLTKEQREHLQKLVIGEETSKERKSDNKENDK